MTVGDTNRAAGNKGEAYAAKQLEKEGYTVVCRNYSCHGGETDIAAVKDGFIVFAEVKLRKEGSGDVASAAVDPAKIKRMLTAARAFLEEYRDNAYISSLTPRIDVIELYTGQNTVKKYNHIENAAEVSFEGCGE